MLRLNLVCIGRLKAGLERDLAGRYLDRARLLGRAHGLALDLTELPEAPERRAEARRATEAAAIASAIGAGTRFIAFDETGIALDSSGFAHRIGAARDTGGTGLALVIGGPDGLDPRLKADASAVVAFGAMTWPHQLVRIMAAEQIYRAVTILAGHPYHRG